MSQSDLQRLPVRAALFGMVTYLELIMIEAIRGLFKDERDWIVHISKERLAMVQREITKAEMKDGLVDALLFTQFGDKIRIIAKCASLGVRKSEFEADLKVIQKLRDHLAHANNYAATPAAADEVCRIVRLIDKWSSHLLPPELARCALGYSTQSAFAASIGITPQRWNNYVGARARLPVDVALSVCKRFRLTLDWLYRGDLSGIPLQVARQIEQLTLTRQDDSVRNARNT